MNAEQMKPSRAKRVPEAVNKKKKIVSIAVLAVGLATLVTGVVFLVLGLNRKSAMQDGEYLVSAGEWALNDSDKVVWDFTEVGKGTLTTDGHLSDYEFIWALEDGKLLMETDWLYELENEYDYTVDQDSGILTLTADGQTYKFVAK